MLVVYLPKLHLANPVHDPLGLVFFIGIMGVIILISLLTRKWDNEE